MRQIKEIISNRLIFDLIASFYVRSTDLTKNPSTTTETRNPWFKQLKSTILEITNEIKMI